MRRYCFNCDAERAVREERRRQSLKVKGEEVEFEAPVLVCEQCGEIVFDAEYDSEVLRRAHDLYRERHGLLTSAEIVRLRERYGFSQRALARLLGWGEITIQRYEKGVIQNRAHDTILRSLQDPRNVLELLGQPDRDLTDAERRRFRAAVHKVLESEQSTWLLEDMQRLLHVPRSDRYTGSREFDLMRFIDVVTWFASHIERLSKTKLAKLLWLADFKHFRKHGVSLTGAMYARLPFGPVPHRFQLLLGLAVEAGAIRLEEELFGEYPGEVVRAVEGIDASRFGSDEIETLTVVLKRFGHYSASMLTSLSHREDAWKERAEGELIPYDEALGIRALED